MFIGKVTRPDFDAGDTPVKLTATVTKGNVTKTVDLNVFVKRLGITDGQAVVKDLAALKLPEKVKENIDLPVVGENGTTISWSSSAPESISNTGLVVRPNVGESDATVTLTATVTKGTESDTKEFTIIVVAWNTEDEVADAAKQIKWSLIAGANTSINLVTSDLDLPAQVGREVNVTWVSSNKSFCEDDGTINRPSFTQGPVIINITATLEKDGIQEIVTISGIRLEPAGITNQEIAIDAVNKLDSSMFIGANTSLSAITTNMTLPTTISGVLSAYCSFSWTLLDEAGEPTTSQYVKLTPKGNSIECVIVRPSSGDSNFIGQLKAVANSTDPSGGTSGSADKTFRIIVLAEDVNP